MLLLFELLGIRLRRNNSTGQFETVLSRTVNTSLAGAFFAQYVHTVGTNVQQGARAVNVPTTPVEIALVVLAMKYDLAITQALETPFAIADNSVSFSLASAMASDELFLSYRKGSSFEITGNEIVKYSEDIGGIVGRTKYVVLVKQDLNAMVNYAHTYSTSSRDVLITAGHTVFANSEIDVTSSFGTEVERRLLVLVAGKLKITATTLHAMLYPYLQIAKLEGDFETIHPYFTLASIPTVETVFDVSTVTVNLFGKELHPGVDIKFPQYGVNNVRELTENVGDGLVYFPVFSDNIEGAAEFVVAVARVLRASSVTLIPPGVIRSSVWFGTFNGTTGKLVSCWLSVPVLATVQKKSFLAATDRSAMKIRPFETGFGAPVRLVFTSGSSGNSVDLTGFVTTTALTNALEPVNDAISTIVPLAKVKDIANAAAPVYYGDKNGQKKQRRR